MVVVAEEEAPRHPDRGEDEHRATRNLAPAAQGFVLAAATLLLVVQVNGLAATANAAANRRLVLHRDRPPLVGSHAQVLHELLRFQERVRPGARVVTYWAGIPAYFADYRLLDAYGYNDRAAARRPLDPAVGWRAYRPGHKPPDVAGLLDRRPDARTLPTSSCRPPADLHRAASLHRVERLCEVGDQVVGVLDADGDADQ